MSLDNDDLPQIPGYTIKKVLGRGGMAQVYLGIQDSMDREVAIKVMFPQLLIEPSFSERFLREAHIAAQLAHPHIVAIIDVGITNDLHYMAMEFQPGGDLSDKIKNGVSEKESIRILKDIAAALDYAHSNGFLHRDIKPDNILFSRSGSTVLSDFGIARATDGGTQLTATGSVIGTPHYMSPEQAMGQAVDGRADIYSLGIMFYQMLVGKIPFDGDSAMSIGIKHIRDPIPELPKHLAQYQNFIEKLLAKNPDDRWQTAADVVRSLEVLEIKSGTADGSATLESAAITGVNSSVQAQETQANPTLTNTKQKKAPVLPITFAAVTIALIAITVSWQQGLLNSESATKEPVPVVTTPPVAAVTPTVKKIATKQTNEKQEEKKVTTKPVLKPKPVEKPKVDPQAIKLSQYLKDAGDFLSPARLSESRLETATRLYKSSYTIAPDDLRVQRLQEQIATGYEVLADELRQQKKWEEALKLNITGLDLMPDHRGLNKQRKKIELDKKASAEAATPRRVFGGF